MPALPPALPRPTPNPKPTRFVMPQGLNHPQWRAGVAAAAKERAAAQATVSNRAG
jgi:hypothetical protein